MLLLAMTLAGALLGGGLLLILRGTVLGAPPPLETVLADLRRPRELHRARQSRIDVLADTIAGESIARRGPDIAINEYTAAKFLEQRLIWAVLGASPGLLFLAVGAAGVTTPLPAAVCLLGVVVGLVGGWFYALVSLRSDAAARRREFRHTLAAYLELVTILMAGGAGIETALYEAAAIGRGSAFRHIQAALSAARARREPPWVPLGALGMRLGVVELQELEASMSLAGDGARVRDSLIAKAESMRGKDLAQIESEAQRRSETMVLPVAMMFAGFLLLIGYPALSGLSGP